MERRYFGTDGIRGLANRSKMSPELAFRLGAAVTHQARQRVSHPPRIVLGKDTRLSGYLFETALASGVCALGGRVLLSGPLPTPAIAHLTTSMRADAGIVVSASHNVYEDNGIKIFGPDGYKLPDQSELDIEALIDGSELDQNRPTGVDIGRAERLDDAGGRYVAFVKATFPANFSLDGLRVVVDAAHGAAYRTAPLVFSELGATVHTIGVEPSGMNINADCGATHPEACAREVRRREAHIGIALDGDADRVIVLDELGQEVDGDAVMALCARHLMRRGKLRNNTVVATVMSNLGLERAIARDGGKLVRCQVGDRYVVEAMRTSDCNFGGEQSGHMIFLDHTTTGDGLVTALQILAVMREEGCALSELARQAIDKVPQVLVNRTLTERKPLAAMPHTQAAIAAVRDRLGSDGRVLVRWSGTETKLRVMVEGPDRQVIADMAADIADRAGSDC